MRALMVTALDGPRALAPVEVDEPVAEESAILVEVHAVGVSFPDLLLTQGRYQYKPELPFVPGGEVAGSCGQRLTVADILRATGSSD